MQSLIAKYGVVRTINVSGMELPVIDIPMMSDERWNELARNQATAKSKEHVSDYTAEVAKSDVQL